MHYPAFRPVRSRHGFTLIELMVVIAIIALLASMSVGVFSYATKKAAGNRTEATLAGIRLGLTSYHSEFNEYPEPANPDRTEEFGKKRYRIGGAMMLYQAMSGDGTNAIVVGNGGDSLGSDGQFTAEEAAQTQMKDMPVTTWKKVGGTYLMIDGFGKPIQYDKGVAGGDAVNESSYDLWSFAEDETNTTNTSRSAKLDPTVSAKWIKNW